MWLVRVQQVWRAFVELATVLWVCVTWTVGIQALELFFTFAVDSYLEVWARAAGLPTEEAALEAALHVEPGLFRALMVHLRAALDLCHHILTAHRRADLQFINFR